MDGKANDLRATGIAIYLDSPSDARYIAALRVTLIDNDDDDVRGMVEGEIMAGDRVLIKGFEKTFTFTLANAQ